MAGGPHVHPDAHAGNLGHARRLGSSPRRHISPRRRRRPAASLRFRARTGNCTPRSTMAGEAPARRRSVFVERKSSARETPTARRRTIKAGLSPLYASASPRRRPASTGSRRPAYCGWADRLGPCHHRGGRRVDSHRQRHSRRGAAAVAAASGVGTGPARPSRAAHSFPALSGDPAHRVQRGTSGAGASASISAEPVRAWPRWSRWLQDLVGPVVAIRVRTRRRDLLRDTAIGGPPWCPSRVFALAGPAVRHDKTSRPRWRAP